MAQSAMGTKTQWRNRLKPERCSKLKRAWRIGKPERAKKNCGSYLLRYATTGQTNRVSLLICERTGSSTNGDLALTITVCVNRQSEMNIAGERLRAHRLYSAKVRIVMQMISIFDMTKN